MSRATVTFPGGGGHQLAGIIDRPAGTPRGWALFAHCFTCGKSLPSAETIAAALVVRGIAVLRFDFTGLGDSDGNFADSNFSSSLDDLVAASEWLAAHESAPSLLVGHSLGGAAVLAAAHRMPAVRALVTIGAPSAPGHVLNLFADHLPAIAADGTVKLSLAGRPFNISQQLLDDLSQANLQQAVHDLKRPLLILHAPLDATVGIDNAGTIFGWARHPKSFVSLAAADHLLKRQADATYAGNVIAAWAEPFLPAYPDTAQGDEWVHVSGAGTGPYQQSIALGRHHLTADEPASLGGGDAGPSPYQLLLAALGACTAITVRMYAQRKGIALADLVVALRHTRRQVGPVATASGAPAEPSERIDRVLSFGNDVDPETVAKLLAIAENCPVHRSLSGAIAIATSQSMRVPG